ncbi:MAG: WXG100 family type VII secretion target [Gracilibacteraceae bacterium]|jgi:WXG100 family type VII secretion target|nr:WXG100 family type VII secretion target [Gracilibacteraceae bacterium]
MADSVRRLDTVNFNDTISAYANHISRFENIVQGVNNSANAIVNCWKGKGRDAFEKDCRQVQLNLKDITSIMYDIRDALIDAHAEYIKSDSDLSKNFES